MPLSALESIGDAELGEISAQKGIALQFGLDINADPGTGQNLTSLCGSTLAALLSGPCRLAVNFANRTDSGGEWLVAKGMYGSLVIDTINLDAGYLGDAAQTSGFYDVDKFRDEGGSCLLLIACGSDGSPDGAFDNLPSIVFSMPTATWSEYTHVKLGLTITGMAVEYGATGYNSDLNGSFLGAKIADNSSDLAGIAFTGDVYIFGF